MPPACRRKPSPARGRRWGSESMTRDAARRVGHRRGGVAVGVAARMR
jgi:hypothetical protein